MCCNIRPKTYFLQEAILRGLAAIEARLDKNQDYRSFFWLKLRPESALEYQIWDLGDDMCGRYVYAFMLGRQATGCADYHDAERALLHDKCDLFIHPAAAGRILRRPYYVYSTKRKAGDRGW